MFRAISCPSSGEITVSMRHLVLVTSFIPPCIPYSHSHRVTNTKCHIHTVISPDDGHIIARNMQRKEINILRKNCAPSWFYLQDYTRMNGQQQNITNFILIKIQCFPHHSSHFRKHHNNIIVVLGFSIPLCERRGILLYNNIPRLSHNGMENPRTTIKFLASQAKSIHHYKGLRSKILKCRHHFVVFDGLLYNNIPQ